MKTTETVKVPQATHRNPVRVAMARRFASTKLSHKHRCEPRGGSRNRQADYRQEA